MNLNQHKYGAPFFAWATSLVVLLGILSAWADPIAGCIINASGLLLVAFWLLRFGFAGGVHWLIIPLLILSAYGLVQIALRWTVSPFETWNAICTWLSRAAFFYLAFATLKAAKLRSSILSLVLGFGTLLGIIGMIQWPTSKGKVLWLIPTAYQDEVFGTFLNRDHYAVFAELILPIALTRALMSDIRWPFSLATGVIYASVVESGSRAGTAIVSIETLIIMGIVLHRKANEYRWVLSAAAIMTMCSIAAGWQYVWFRFHSTNLFAFRREMALASIQMIHTRPFIGFGLGTWPMVYPAFAFFDPPGFYMNHAHNDWLELIAEGGLVVAMTILAIGCESIFLSRTSLWAIGIPAALMHALVDFPLQKPAIATLMFFLLGAAAAAAQTGNRKNVGHTIREEGN